MGTKIPEGTPTTLHGDGMGTQRALDEKYAWQMDRAQQFNPTASILRYTFSSGSAYEMSRGTQTLVSGLADLLCTVESYNKALERKFGSIAESNDRLFTFYDVQVVSTDRVSYGGDVWEPVAVWYEAESGRCDVQARLVAEL
jgi:hypothetical protein